MKPDHSRIGAADVTKAMRIHYNASEESSVQNVVKDLQELEKQINKPDFSIAKML